jgi:hypothetical protein
MDDITLLGRIFGTDDTSAAAVGDLHRRLDGVPCRGA